MIIKSIIGKSLSGKSMELVKEIENKTLFVCTNLIEDDILSVLNKLNMNSEKLLSTTYHINRHHFTLSSFRNMIMDRGIETILTDINIEDGVFKNTLYELEKLGIKKVVYTRQINY